MLYTFMSAEDSSTNGGASGTRNDGFGGRHDQRGRGEGEGMEDGDSREVDNDGKLEPPSL